jgi:hypothetical protein
MNSAVSLNDLSTLHNNERPLLARRNNRCIKHDPFATDSSLSATANTNIACSKHEKLSADLSCIYETEYDLFPMTGVLVLLAKVFAFRFVARC